MEISAIETSSIITLCVVRPASITLVILWHRFIYFANLLHTSISPSKYAPISGYFIKKYACGSCGAAVFRSE